MQIDPCSDMMAVSGFQEMPSFDPSSDMTGVYPVCNPTKKFCQFSDMAM